MARSLYGRSSAPWLEAGGERRAYNVLDVLNYITGRDAAVPFQNFSCLRVDVVKFNVPVLLLGLADHLGVLRGTHLDQRMT